MMSLSPNALFHLLEPRSSPAMLGGYTLTVHPTTMAPAPAYYWSRRTGPCMNKALIAGLRLDWHMGAEEVQVYSDSQLVVNQLKEDYEAKNSWMNQVISLTSEFKSVAFDHVGRDLNSHVDALASLRAVCVEHDGSHTIVLGEVPLLSFEPDQREIMAIQLRTSWMDPLVSYLKHSTLPADQKEAHKIRCKFVSYFLDPSSLLDHRSYTAPISEWSTSRSWKPLCSLLNLLKR
ncbi:hypothetical protein RHSIM_Rhsim02G0126100 [Rhododendron simsii]|uniref:RNase H type-1 domain-containing protein n=1 Tax=Rhododendron simsii TaxID=118357 RepID=A0A834HD86_RHOSS|nr:hypothetical protein RHSIM_Rhsim02G0126100 [Rhododendron simsii]